MYMYFILYRRTLIIIIIGVKRYYYDSEIGTPDTSVIYFGLKGEHNSEVPLYI